MPITVLDSRDAAVNRARCNRDRAGAVRPSSATAYCRGATTAFDEPMPTIAPPSGAIALPNSQVPQCRSGRALDLPSLAGWADVQEYLASNEEGRLGSQLYHDKKIGWTWDGSWVPTSASSATARRTPPGRKAGNSMWTAPRCRD